MTTTIDWILGQVEKRLRVEACRLLMVEKFGLSSKMVDGAHGVREIMDWLKKVDLSPPPEKMFGEGVASVTASDLSLNLNERANQSKDTEARTRAVCESRIRFGQRTPNSNSTLFASTPQKDLEATTRVVCEAIEQRLRDDLEKEHDRMVEEVFGPLEADGLPVAAPDQENGHGHGYG